jgi:two-component system LytT family response regulator
MTLRTVIVDDEPLARQRVRQLLAGETDVEVLAECRNGVEALAVIRDASPDIVFLDVQMPEMDGFQVLAELGAAAMPVVVFVTAYDEYALRAFDVHALDYLLKPFDSRRFRETMRRARQQVALRDTAEASRKVLALLGDVQQRRGYLQRFAVRSAGRVIVVATREVQAIEADGNYMRLHTLDRKEHLVRGTMDEVAGRLDPQRFVRVHRSWIVNLDQVNEIQQWFHGSQAVLLRQGLRVPVGRKYAQVVVDLLQRGA